MRLTALTLLFSFVACVGDDPASVSPPGTTDGGSDAGADTPQEAPFSLTLNPTAIRLPSGGVATATVTVVPVGSFAGDVIITVSGLPPGVLASPLSGSGTLTLHAEPSAAATVADVNVVGASGVHSVRAPLEIALTRPGDLDVSFGRSGTIEHGVSDFFVPEALVVQPDDKLLIGGRMNATTTASGAVLRLLADGKLDPSFGKGGVVELGSALEDVSTGMVLQSDGRIVLGGGTGSGMKLMRLSTEGVVDPTFSFANDQIGQAIAVHRDDAHKDALLVGYGRFESGHFVTRLLENGALDATYVPTDAQHRVALPPNGDRRPDIDTLAIARNGDAIVGGSGSTGASFEFTQVYFAHLTSTGEVAGLGTPSPNNGALAFNVKVAFGPNDEVRALNAKGLAIHGLTPSFGLDSKWGTDGIATASFSADVQGSGLAFQADRKVLAAAHVGPSVPIFGITTPRATFVRFTPEGTVDPAFGTKGSVAPYPFLARSVAIATQRDGRIITLSARDIGPDDGGPKTAQRAVVSRLWH